LQISKIDIGAERLYFGKLLRDEPSLQQEVIAARMCKFILRLQKIVQAAGNAAASNAAAPDKRHAPGFRFASELFQEWPVQHAEAAALRTQNLVRGRRGGVGAGVGTAGGALWSATAEGHLHRLR
jgi:hypothetical protein